MDVPVRTLMAFEGIENFHLARTRSRRPGRPGPITLALIIAEGICLIAET